MKNSTTFTFKGTGTRTGTNKDNAPTKAVYIPLLPTSRNISCSPNSPHKKKPSFTYPYPSLFWNLAVVTHKGEERNMLRETMLRLEKGQPKTLGKKIELARRGSTPSVAWEKEGSENVGVNVNVYENKPRHSPPANKEWFNSIYTYGKATQKLAPTLDKVTQKLVKGYLDIYSDKLEGRVKPITKRMRRWARRLSTNRILISRAELKHTNDRVVITVYVYNRQKQYYLNKIAGLGAIVNSFHVLPTKTDTDSLELRKRLKVVRLQSERIKSSMARIRDRMKKQIKVVDNFTCYPPLRSPFLPPWKKEVTMNDNLAPQQEEKEKVQVVAKTDLETQKVLWLARAREYERSYLKNYISRSLRREMLAIYLLQLASFNSSKFDSKYLLPLTNLLRRVYSAKPSQRGGEMGGEMGSVDLINKNREGSLIREKEKEVTFNFVNLKYPYLNSSLLSSILVAKIKNRKTKLLTVLRASLAMYEVPRLETEQRATLYKEIYDSHRKRRLPNIKVEENSHFLSSSVGPALMESATTTPFDSSASTFNHVREQDAAQNGLRWGGEMESKTGKKLYPQPPFPDTTSVVKLVNTTLGSIKNKAVTGIRLEVAGRLTRRYTAARSLFKLRYKGNIKNMDASNKGLSAVLLRGYAKSNLGYTQTSSRVRIGSFGVKGWVSSS